MSGIKTVNCPTCDAEVKWQPESKYRPFCSHRCRLIDLGEWVEGSNRIPGEELPSGLEHEELRNLN